MIEYITNRIKFLTTPFLLIFAFTSCEKDKAITIDEPKIIIIKGTVYDATTFLTLKNTEIELYWCGPTATNYCNRTFVSKTSSNEYGNYEFKYETTNKDIFVYDIEVTKENYFKFGEIEEKEGWVYNDSIQNGISYLKNIYLQPEAIMQIHFKNISPYDSLDSFNFYFAPFHTGWQGEICSDGGYYYGTNIDSTFECKTYGNQYTIIQWNVNKNGISYIYTDSVYCSAFDTTLYNINY